MVSFTTGLWGGIITVHLVYFTVVVCAVGHMSLGHARLLCERYTRKSCQPSAPNKLQTILELDLVTMGR